jgi:hypothetical protein
MAFFLRKYLIPTCSVHIYEMGRKYETEINLVVIRLALSKADSKAAANRLPNGQACLRIDFEHGYYPDGFVLKSPTDSKLRIMLW